MHSPLLTVLIILLIVGALGGGYYGRGAGWYGPHPGNPNYTPSSNGYYFSSGLGAVLFIVLLLLLLGVL
jgi:hypothetical protein